MKKIAISIFVFITVVVIGTQFVTKDLLKSGWGSAKSATKSGIDFVSEKFSGDDNSVEAGTETPENIKNEDPEPESEPAQDEDSDNDWSLDGDEQKCPTKCNWDIGVNEYSDGSTSQVGFAYGKSISWDDETLDEKYNLVRLEPGFYEDLTVQDGGVLVFNLHDGSIEDLTEFVANDVFRATGVETPSFEDVPVWESAEESIQNSAEGPEGVGEGLEYPQLDDVQAKSCTPLESPCEFPNISVAENQIGIMFGVQVATADEDGEYILAGPATKNTQESVSDPELRCDLVILSEGEYEMVVLNDARIEVYNVPSSDFSGWARNLVAERAEEQALHYNCPHWEEVPVWSPEEVVGQYLLEWEGNDATASGPENEEE